MPERGEEGSTGGATIVTIADGTYNGESVLTVELWLENEWPLEDVTTIAHGKFFECRTSLPPAGIGGSVAGRWRRMGGTAVRIEPFTTERAEGANITSYVIGAWWRREYTRRDEGLIFWKEAMGPWTYGATRLYSSMVRRVTSSIIEPGS